MSTSRSRSFGVLSLLTALMVVAAAFLLLPSVTLSAPPPTQGVRIEAIGHPIWEPVDFHLFSAPVGTADSGYAEFGDTLAQLLPPPNHGPHNNLGIGPGVPHSSYDTEFATSIANLGYFEGVRFSTEQFSNGQGVFLVWMNVPSPGTTGSSPDFTSGPVIPNSLFPIHVYGTSSHNGALFDQFMANFYVPALDGTLDPPFTVDGHSHFPVFITDNADFGPANTKLKGSYTFDIQMVDASGSGWTITAHFTVAP